MMWIDSEITARVIAALLNDPHASASLIEVNHEHGVVTLSGTVLSEEARRMAEEVVRRQKGVRSIINNLCVAPRQWKRAALRV